MASSEPCVTEAADKNVCSRDTGDPCLREEKLQLDSHRHAHHMHLLCLSGEGGLTFFLSSNVPSTWDKEESGTGDVAHKEGLKKPAFEM